MRIFSFQRRKRPRRSRPRESRRRRGIEERVSGSTRSEHVYSPTDRWDLIRRRLFTTSGPGSARWCLRDGFDPIAPLPTSAHAWTRLFHAEFIDPETGLYNYGYRSYHPQLGRWISRDPIGEARGLNLYAFVGNDGVNAHDYLGLRACLSYQTLQKEPGVCVAAVWDIEWMINGHSRTHGSIYQQITTTGHVEPRGWRRGERESLSTRDFTEYWTVQSSIVGGVVVSRISDDGRDLFLHRAMGLRTKESAP